MTSSPEFVFFKNIHFERYIMELLSDTTFWSSFSVGSWATKAVYCSPICLFIS